MSSSDEESLNLHLSDDDQARQETPGQVEDKDTDKEEEKSDKEKTFQDAFVAFVKEKK